MSENLPSKQNRKEKWLLFAAGCALGAVLFVLICGVRVLDVTYDAWIFDLPDPDIQQHYIGWCHFRTAPWSLPPGLMSSLSYPFPMSVLWTDSIPLFALIFKLFRGILPETFQYLGWFALLSEVLTGGVSALLLHRITGKRSISLIGSTAFILSFPMQHRLFYHTTLMAQWLILLPLLFWLSDAYLWSAGKKCEVWSALSLCGILIHPYLWFMGEAILGFALIEELLLTKKWKPVLLTGFLSLMAAVLGLWTEGAFSGNVDASGGFGGFEANWDTLFNPMEMGRLLPSYPLLTELQYEGFGYLGAGILLLLLITVIYAVRRNFRKVPERQSDAERQADLKRQADSGTGQKKGPKMLPNASGGKRLRGILLLLMALCFWCAAVFPRLSFHDRLFLEFPLTDGIRHLLGIFRANGRFVWPVDYLLMAAAFLWTRENPRDAGKIPVSSGSGEPEKTNRTQAWIFLLVCGCILLQILDLSPILTEKHQSLFKEHKAVVCDLDEPALLAVLEDYHHIVMAYDEHMDMMRFAYFAARHGLTINRFYFARGIEEAIEEEMERSREAVAAGQAREDTLYILRKENYEDGWKDFPLHFYDLKGTIVGTVSPIPGLQPLD